MDYKRVKSGREKGLVWLALILTAVILVQCVMNIVLIVSNRQTKAMFDEALQGQLTMQEEINSLKGIDNGNTENTDNAENSEKTVQKKTEINKCGVKIYESSVTDKQRRS